MFEKLKERTIKFLFGMLKMELIIVSISIIGMGTLEVVYLATSVPKYKLISESLPKFSIP